VSFPSLSDISLSLAYGLYTVFAVLSFLFVLRWVRETKGVELEEMHGDTSAVRGDARRSG
jgi:MFS transporter, SP family, sugar:H+ symporter